MRCAEADWGPSFVSLLLCCLLSRSCADPVVRLIPSLGGLFVLVCTWFNSQLPFNGPPSIAPAYHQRLCHRGNSRSLAG